MFTTQASFRQNVSLAWQGGKTAEPAGRLTALKRRGYLPKRVTPPVVCDKLSTITEGPLSKVCREELG